MLAISMALMTAPQMLLLDEPSAGLSPTNVQRLFDSFASMRDELGTSVLLTTGRTEAPSASRRSQRAAMALSSSIASVQANPSPMQFLMP